LGLNPGFVFFFSFCIGGGFDLYNRIFKGPPKKFFPPPPRGGGEILSGDT